MKISKLSLTGNKTCNSGKLLTYFTGYNVSIFKMTTEMFLKNVNSLAVTVKLYYYLRNLYALKLREVCISCTR